MNDDIKLAIKLVYCLKAGHRASFFCLGLNRL